jgi:alkylhydroperoxidase family enzyme
MREKAAFAWAESVTLISDRGAPKALFDALLVHFSEEQIVDLTLIIAQMNAWNRLAISFGHLPELRAE